MTRHVVLLRGINVGGNHRLAMARCRELLADAGFIDVKTFIQSGNLVLTSDDAPAEVAARVRQVLEADAGFPIPTVALAGDDFLAVLAANPFRPAAPKLEHVVLLPEPLDQVRAERLTALAAADETSSELALGDRAVYLLHPDGLSTSRLAQQATTLLRDGTARNLATMTALVGMLQV